MRVNHVTRIKTCEWIMSHVLIHVNESHHTYHYMWMNHVTRMNTCEWIMSHMNDPSNTYDCVMSRVCIIYGGKTNCRIAVQCYTVYVCWEAVSVGMYVCVWGGGGMEGVKNPAVLHCRCTCVWRGSFTCVMWLIHRCDMICIYMWPDEFTIGLTAGSWRQVYTGWQRDMECLKMQVSFHKKSH